MFPDGTKSAISNYTFQPVAFVGFEPPSVDINGSSPVAALFSPNISPASSGQSFNETPGFEGLIGDSGPLWKVPGQGRDVRQVVLQKQTLVAVQAGYQPADADEIQAHPGSPFQFPVALSWVIVIFKFLHFLTESCSGYRFRSFTTSPIHATIIFPQAFADPFVNSSRQ
jgi:hypothetical protein